MPKIDKKIEKKFKKTSKNRKKVKKSSKNDQNRPKSTKKKSSKSHWIWTNKKKDYGKISPKKPENLKKFTKNRQKSIKKTPFLQNQQMIDLKKTSKIDPKMTQFLQVAHWKPTSKKSTKIDKNRQNRPKSTKTR